MKFEFEYSVLFTTFEIGLMITSSISIPGEGWKYRINEEEVGGVHNTADNN